MISLIVQKTITVSLMPPLPPLLPLMNHPMLIIVFVKGTVKIQVAGSRKIWGTLKSTTTSAVSNAVCSLTGMNADNLIFKRKYKTNPTKNSSKWWFGIRSDEALLKDLEEKWHLIALQTNWKIEPVLRLSDDPNAASPNHQPDVICIVESWLDKEISDSELSLSGYNVSRVDRNRHVYLYFCEIHSCIQSCFYW